METTATLVILPVLGATGWPLVVVPVLSTVKWLAVAALAVLATLAYAHQSTATGAGTARAPTPAGADPEQPGRRAAPGPGDPPASTDARSAGRRLRAHVTGSAVLAEDASRPALRLRPQIATVAAFAALVALPGGGALDQIPDVLRAGLEDFGFGQVPAVLALGVLVAAVVVSGWRGALLDLTRDPPGPTSGPGTGDPSPVPSGDERPSAHAGGSSLRRPVRQRAGSCGARRRCARVASPCWHWRWWRAASSWRSCSPGRSPSGSWPSRSYSSPLPRWPPGTMAAPPVEPAPAAAPSLRRTRGPADRRRAAGRARLARVAGGSRGAGRSDRPAAGDLPPLPRRGRVPARAHARPAAGLRRACRPARPRPQPLAGAEHRADGRLGAVAAGAGRCWPPPRGRPRWGRCWAPPGRWRSPWPSSRSRSGRCSATPSSPARGRRSAGSGWGGAPVRGAASSAG